MTAQASSAGRQPPVARSETRVEASAGEAFLSVIAEHITTQLQERLGLAGAAVASSSSSGTQRAVFCVTEAAEVLGISRALAYELVRRGELPSVRLGRRVVVPRIALDRLFEEALSPMRSEQAITARALPTHDR